MKLEFKRIEKPYFFEVENASGAKLNIDAAPEIGGTNRALRPMELLASGLAGCIAIDVLSILKKQRVDTENFGITIEGKRVEGIPSPFESIHLCFHVDSQINRDQLSRNIELVIEKYCSVSASLSESVQITFEIDNYAT